MNLRGKLVVALVMVAVEVGAHFSRADEPTLRNTFKVNRPVESVAFTHDGKTLIMRSGLVIVLRNLVSGKETTMQGGLPGSTNMAFSSTGKILILSNQSHVPMMLVDIASGKGAPIQSGRIMALSPDGRTLVESDVETKGILVQRLAKAFDPTKVKTSATIEGNFLSNPLPTFSSDSRILAVRTGSASAMSDPASIILWDVLFRKEIATITDADTWFGFSPDNKLLAAEVVVPSDSPSLDPRVKTILRIKLFDVASGTEIGTLEEERGIAGPVIFSPDSKTLAAVRVPAEKYLIKVWSAETGKSIATLEESPNRINDPVVFSPNSKLVAALCGDTGNRLSAITIWDISSSKIVASLPTGGDNGSGTPPAFSPDGKTLAAGCGDGTVKLWTIVGGEKAE